ncbi:MAG TPA: pectin acetylesterase-family hydrolase [Polyangiaceae bacterium]
MKRLSLVALGVLSMAFVFGCSSGDTAKSTAAGAEDGGPDARPPFVPTGEPLTGDNLKWTWIDFPDSSCRDGSTAGVAVSLNSASDKLMIYLEGGGACFDSITCAGNPANVGKQKAEQTAGLFDRSNAQNPVKDWNYVYIPYCTGDIHAGTNENGSIDGLPGTQKFVGRRNMEAYLQRIVPTFSKASQVLLTGISAGGFGAASNSDLVGRAFGSKVPISLIDDSGPSMSSKYLPACLQDKWRQLWGFDDSILKDCGNACPKKDDYTLDFSKFLAKKYPKRESGVIESNNDGVITLFYGYGRNDCTGSLTTPVPAAEFDAGLQDLRAQMAQFPKVLTYFPASTQHTWVGDATLYTEAEGGTKLLDWVTAITNDTPAENVGQ